MVGRWPRRWWRVAAAGILIAAVAATAIALRAPPARPRIVRVEQETVNLGRQHYRIVAAVTPTRFEVPLSELHRWLPATPPAPLPQSGPCPSRHLVIRVTMSNGTAYSYGPCQIPAKVGVLRHNLALAYGRSGISMKLEHQKVQAYAQKLAASPPFARPHTPAAFPLTGGSVDQHQIIRALVASIPPSAFAVESAVIRNNYRPRGHPAPPGLLTLVSPIPPDETRSGWASALNIWAGELLLRSYNNAAHRSGLPELSTLNSGPRLAGGPVHPEADYSPVGRERVPGHAPAVGLRDDIQRAVSRAGLRVVQVDVLDMRGPHAYVELRTDDPWHVVRQLNRVYPSIYDLLPRMHEIVTENPCGTPIVIQSAEGRQGSVWADPAWVPNNPWVIGGDPLGGPVAVHRPPTACG